MSKLWLSGALTALLFLIPALRGENADGLPRGTIRVHAVGPFGGIPGNIRIQVLTEDCATDLVNDATNPVVTNVPYGRYILRVMGSDRVTKRLITVDSPELWVNVGVSFEHGDRRWLGGDLTISGSVTPRPRMSAGWWVRVEGTFLEDKRECLLSPSGRFAITGLEMGTYLVEVFEKSRLLGVHQVDIDAKQPVTHVSIDLGQPVGLQNRIKENP